MIHIVIPVRQESTQLDATLATIENHSNEIDYEVKIIKDSTINVSEARQQALEDESLSDRILYMDDDSLIIHDNWIDNMVAVMDANPNAAAVFAGEWWGTMPQTPIVPVPGDVEVEIGPAACMLIDRSRLTPFIHWDQNIGLRNTWLGGDFEEVDFCYRIRHEGLCCMRSTKTLFHHAGEKTNLGAFSLTDRGKTVQIMRWFLERKYNTVAEDEDYFKHLRYVKASDENMDMLAPGESLRTCYSHVVDYHGLQERPFVKRHGLI